MTAIRVAVLGLVVLAVCAGWATGTFASPTPYEIQKCEGVWNPAVGVCDIEGD